MNAREICTSKMSIDTARVQAAEEFEKWAKRWGLDSTVTIRRECNKDAFRRESALTVDVNYYATEYVKTRNMFERTNTHKMSIDTARGQAAKEFETWAKKWGLLSTITMRRDWNEAFGGEFTSVVDYYATECAKTRDMFEYGDAEIADGEKEF